jgi:hypothetical protein
MKIFGSDSANDNESVELFFIIVISPGNHSQEEMSPQPHHNSNLGATLYYI